MCAHSAVDHLPLKDGAWSGLCASWQVHAQLPVFSCVCELPELSTESKLDMLRTHRLHIVRGANSEAVACLSQMAAVLLTLLVATPW